MPSFGVHLENVRRGERLPARYAQEKVGGRNVSPPLHIEAVPGGAQSIAFALIDRDAHDYVHWMAVGVPAADLHIGEGASQHAMPPGTRELFNDAQYEGYAGPKPPPRTGAHRYELEVFALDVPTVDLPAHVTYDQFRKTLEPHTLGTAENYWMFEDTA